MENPYQSPLTRPAPPGPAGPRPPRFRRWVLLLWVAGVGAAMAEVAFHISLQRLQSLSESDTGGDLNSARTYHALLSLLLVVCGGVLGALFYCGPLALRRRWHRKKHDTR
ncbi:hypothetical protein Pla175_43940 [Pirellulimonas nuda]|uniref:Uncharacterized protein n=1 Tax=Pirellulimonas nuda TaxID=2528009 RepID=A0A518DHM8_9BACT|nr:hypothetical protein [Pirellulimonas nuda]QDU90979.1 hypothetical protein Pla175_43940 [Pirellulimonas nuda]